MMLDVTSHPATAGEERLGPSLLTRPAIGMGGRCQLFMQQTLNIDLEPSSGDIFRPSTEGRNARAAINPTNPFRAAPPAPFVHTMHDDCQASGGLAQVSSTVRPSASPAAGCSSGGSTDGCSTRGQPGSSPSVPLTSHTDGHTDFGSESAPASTGPPVLPAVVSTHAGCQPAPATVTSRVLESSTARALHIHDDPCPMQEVGGGADRLLQVDATSRAATSPFLQSPRAPGRSALLAFQALITIVLVLGASGYATPNVPEGGGGNIVASIAAQYSVELLGRSNEPSLLDRWLWLTSIAEQPHERLVFHCYMPQGSIGYAGVLSGAVRWLRTRASLQRPPPLMAGDWSMGDIFRRWPPNVAVELASFAWPITTVTEFTRLLGCSNARPLALMGCEFTGATRDAYSRLHSRVAISVDRRRSLTPGPHAVMDLAAVALLTVWLDVFIYPPCTHQVLSDTRAGYAKRQDGRSFWGIAFFIFCWCVVAYRLRIEQPNTIIPEYVMQPTQRLRPCDAGDPDTKPINLYQRDCGPVALLHEPVAATSAHYSLREFRSADERDRWRSSWARFPALCAAIVVLTAEQLESDSLLPWGWRRAGSDGVPCNADESGAIWGVPPPNGKGPTFKNMMEAFAVAWYKAGYPVPHDYLNGEPLPVSEADRKYQSRRGVGHGERIAGVVPLSLRSSTCTAIVPITNQDGAPIHTRTLPGWPASAARL